MKQSKHPLYHNIKSYGSKIKVAWKTLKFRVNPFVCMDCNCPIDHKFPEYHYTNRHNNRVVLIMIGTTGTHPNKGLCGKCLAVRIHSVFTEAEHTTSRSLVRDHVHTITARCDGCGKTTDTLDICYKPQCNIRFGADWWNGHNMCEECLTDAAKYGKPTSGVYVWDHWHRYTVNSVGAAVTLDHWWTVLFPPKRKRHDEK